MIKSENRLLYSVILCVVLVILAVSSYATNLLPNSSFENFTVGTTQTADWQYGDWAFAATSESGGIMEVVSPGQDGNVAIKLSRTSTSGDTAFGTWNTTDKLHLTPVTAGHRYVLRVWARTDDSVTLRFQVASFEDDTWLGDSPVAYVHPQTKWTLYQMTYEAPEGATYAAVSFRNMSIGSLYIDNASMEDENTIVGNLFPDPSFDSFIAGSNYTGESSIGSFRFFSTISGLGSMSVISPGQDGDTAIRLTRYTTGDDTGFGPSSSPIDTRIPVTAEKTYRLSLWARSDTDEYFRFTAAGYISVPGSSMLWTGDTSWGFNIPATPSGVWNKYSFTYTPVNTNTKYTTAVPTYLAVAFRTRWPGSVDIDNITVQDITSTTLSGNVTSAVTGSPISGAVVSIASTAMTLATTTDSAGFYSFSGLSPAEYNIAVSANGYSSYHAYDYVVTGTVTKDASLMPKAAGPSAWVITDTFTRDDNTELGHTEDANAIPWEKTAENSGASIFGNELLIGASCGAYLGRGFAPADFDMFVKMTWKELYYSKWSRINYRQSEPRVYNKGYCLYCPYTDDNGNATIQLQYNGTSIISALVNAPNWENVTLRLCVNGNRHKIWINGTKVIDTIDSHKTDGGYFGFLCDGSNSVSFDDFNMTPSATEQLKTPVIRCFDVSAAASGLSAARRYDIYHATACIEGLVNRETPRLFVRYHAVAGSPDDSLWLTRLIEPGGLCENWPVSQIQTLSALIDTYRSYINGVIVYDDTTGVLSTSLAATTAAGIEGAIAVRKDTSSDSLYTFLTTTKNLPVLIDLSGKFTGSGTIWGTNTASTGSAKCDAYIWAKEKYIDTGKCNPTVLSYTLDEYGLLTNHIDQDSQLANLDYAVAKKGFCFDLDPWYEVPSDDPTQPSGTDYNTFRAILNACNTQTNQNKMIKFCGFPRWDVKYTDYNGIGGNNSPSATEGAAIELLTAYNTYMEPSAPHPCWVANTSFYSALMPAVYQRRYVQNPAPTYNDMVQRGFINSNGNVVAGNYIMMGLGDYDGPCWPLYQLGYESQHTDTPIWDDTARGNVYCNWGINPNLIERASVAMDYFFRHKSDKDCFIAWSSGAGYFDPNKLYGTRTPSGYGSAVSIMQAHSRDYYRLLDYSISGWMFPSPAGTVTSTDYANYAPFSGDGIGAMKTTAGSQILVNNTPCNTIASSWDSNYSTNVINYSSGVHFGWYQTTLWTPTRLKNLQDYWGTTNNHQFVDAYTYYYLLRYYLGGNNNYRATWVGDTIPRIMVKGQTSTATVTVRNDGWDTWSEADRYSLSYAIVNPGTAVQDSNYDANGRYQIPSGTVAPGQTVTFTVNVTAPSTNGNYDLYYDMVRDGVTWFHAANNIEWKKQIIVADSITDVDTDGDGVPDVNEDENGSVYWNPDDDGGAASPAPVNVGTISNAKSETDGTSVSLTEGKVVTAIFKGAFYIEDSDRSSGIKVVSNDAVLVGSKVTLSGTLGTLNGERIITATYDPVVVGTGAVLPLGMTNKTLGGANITDGSGLGNVGLLVRVWGNIIDRSHDGYIVIDDGSGLNVKVNLANVSKTIDGSTELVTLTGICSVENIGGVVTPVIIPRNDGDASW